MSLASMIDADYVDTGDSHCYQDSETQRSPSDFSEFWKNNGTLDPTVIATVEEAIQSYLPLNSTHSDEEFSYDTRDYQSNTTPIPGNNQVCLGMIHKAPLKLTEGNLNFLALKLQHQANSANNKRVLNFKVERKMDHLTMLLANGENFGMLNQSMIKSLGPLMQDESLFLEGTTHAQTLHERLGRMFRAADCKINIDINVYGPRDRARAIGDKLSENKIWLQRPENYRIDYPYENPHVISFADIDNTPTSIDGVPTASDEAGPLNKNDKLQRMVSAIHEGLQRARELRRTDGSLKLQNKLLDHQKQALTFMMERESGDIPEKYRLWERSSDGNHEMYIHRVTKARSALRPEERGGGILADEMGMGKSLCVLALILDTLEKGHEWAQQRHSEAFRSSKVQKCSRSTLIIVPSALLINNWSREIEKHLNGELKWIRYHGLKRERDQDTLADSDLVITTYQTLFCESANKRSELHKIEWYRVVLDEAHIIRRPTNNFHKVCSKIEARSRWCLTGTPIQNRLLDIGALFSFLRAKPFDDLSHFRRYITVPFDNGNVNVKERLILLYESLCLRRGKEILGSPGIDEQERKLVFSTDERSQYNAMFETLERTRQEDVGQHDKRNKFSLFQTQLQLRILCNHGTYQKHFSWKSKNWVLQLDESLAVSLGTNFESRCDGCGQPRPAFIQKKNCCGHFICDFCLDYLGTIAEFNDSMVCPRCHFRDYAKSTQKGTRPVVNKHYRRQDRDCKMYFHDTGYSIKMTTLVQDVKHRMEEMKSIVFTCWTYTLDLVSRHFDREGIEYARIDGDTPMGRRQKVLDEFDGEGSAVRVLLMTTGTGAFGLNIPAASRVFILEPQWNPSVEEQAIARTTRLDQKAKVTVIRYRIEQTIEMQMVSQQRRKNQIARLVQDSAA